MAIPATSDPLDTLSELRLTYGPGYRVYYVQDGNRVILLLCGGDKSNQTKDIAKTHKLAGVWRSEKDRDDGDQE